MLNCLLNRACLDYEAVALALNHGPGARHRAESWIVGTGPDPDDLIHFSIFCGLGTDVLLKTFSSNCNHRTALLEHCGSFLGLHVFV